METKYQKDIKIDSHIHLFNHLSPIPLINSGSYTCNTQIGFMDLKLDEKKINVLGSYKKFIENDLPKTNNKIILLATSTSQDDIEKLLNKYPDIIKGIGELKCYDYYNGKRVPFKNKKFLNECCKISQDYNNIPIFIHWDIKNQQDIYTIDSLCKNYPNIPIVLCHCGMNKELYKSYAYVSICELLNKHLNLWTDISFYALSFFQKNPFLLLKMPLNRILWGSDANNALFIKNKEPIKKIENDLNTAKKLRDIVDFDKNSMTLFGLEDK